MADETVAKPTPAAAKKTVKAAGKPEGIIVYNKNLNTWRAVNDAGHTVLTGSKASLSTKFPTFLVKE